MVVIWFRTLLYTYSQKVWAENSVLFESSRGLNFFNTLTIIIIMRVSLVTKINKLVHTEMFNAVKILVNYFKYDL